MINTPEPWECDWHQLFMLLKKRGYSFQHQSRIVGKNRDFVYKLRQVDSPSEKIRVSEARHFYRLMRKHNLQIPKKTT